VYGCGRTDGKRGDRVARRHSPNVLIHPSALTRSARPRASRRWANPASLPGWRTSCNRARTPPDPAWEQVAPVHPDRRAAGEPEPLGLLVGVDRHQLDLGLGTRPGRHTSQGLLRLQVGRAPLKVQHLYPRGRTPRAAESGQTYHIADASRTPYPTERVEGRRSRKLVSEGGRRAPMP
jgi:hypothetical protein